VNEEKRAMGQMARVRPVLFNRVSLGERVRMRIADELCAEHAFRTLFSFLANSFLRGGLSGAKIPGRRASWRRTFGILSSPDPDGLPSTCDALPDECSLLCKGRLFARAKLSMCECREPSGNPSGSGVRSATDNPPQLVVERGFPRNHYPSPMWGGNKGAPNKTCVR
jgi:hypothetical protein